MHALTWLLRATSCVLFLLGARVRGWFGRFIAWLFGTFLRVRRQPMQHALTRAGIAVRVDCVYSALGESLAELFGVWGAGPRHALPVELSAELLAALAAHRGPLVVAACHAGQFEAAAYRLGSVRPVAVLVHAASARGVRAWLSVQRTRFGLAELAGVGALRAALQHLRAGRTLCVVVDQVPSTARGALRAEFLGAQAWLDPSAFVLAARAACPLLLVATTRVAPGESRVELLAAYPTITSASWRSIALAAHARVAEHVRAHPAEWLWLHRRWREPRRS